MLQTLVSSLSAGPVGPSDALQQVSRGLQLQSLWLILLQL